MLVALAFTLTTTAQIINVTGGPGRVNNNTVIEGLPFTASVSGLNGTPQRWTVGIGTVGSNNDLILNTSSTTISNAIVNRPIDGNTAVISVGATNGRGVSRFLTVVPQTCESELRFLRAFDCSIIGVGIIPAANGATGYSWTVSPSTPFTNNGASITLTNPNQFTTYTVNVNITGGICDGETISGQVNCALFEAPPIEDENIENSQFESLRLFPNPVAGDEINLDFGQSAENYRLSIFNESGQPVEGISIEKQGNAAKLGISNLQPGTYYLRAINANGEAETQRFKVE